MRAERLQRQTGELTIAPIHSRSKSPLSGRRTLFSRRDVVFTSREISCQQDDHFDKFESGDVRALPTIEGGVRAGGTGAQTLPTETAPQVLQSEGRGNDEVKSIVCDQHFEDVSTVSVHTRLQQL
jgi:hypothetical protein